MALISITITMALLAILGGILILVWPKLLSYIVAIWLILYGVLQLVSDLLPI